jgi:hypothetical protein
MGPLETRRARFACHLVILFPFLYMCAYARPPSRRGFLSPLRLVLFPIYYYYLP